MEEFKRICLKECENLARSRTSKVISKQKYRKMVRVLRGEESNPQLKCYMKTKGFFLIDQPEQGLTDVLVVPHKVHGSEGKEDSGKMLQVVTSDELFDIVESVHNIGKDKHEGGKKIESILHREYYGIPRSYIRFHIRECPLCKLRTQYTPRKLPEATSEQMDVEEYEEEEEEENFWTRIQVDVIDLSQLPDDDYKYICHVSDCRTKYTVLFPLKSNFAEEVAIGLEEKVFPYLGIPRIFHSNYGREFVSKFLHYLSTNWGEQALFVNGAPHHNSSSDEQENEKDNMEVGILTKITGQNPVTKILEQIAEKKGNKEGGSLPWSKWLTQAMFIMNGDFNDNTGASPFQTVFGNKYTGVATSPGPHTWAGVIQEEDILSLINALPGKTELDTQ